MVISSQKQNKKCKINTKNQTYKTVNIKILKKIKNKETFFSKDNNREGRVR